MICKMIKSKLGCDNISLFAKNIIDDVELNINNGIGVLNGYSGRVGNSIRVCSNNNFDCDDTNLVSSSEIFKLYELIESDKFNFKYGFLDINLDVTILDELNILTISSEEIAFNIFKNSPTNYIFIIPTSKHIVSHDSSTINLMQEYSVLIYLYNKTNLYNNEYLNTIDTIENDIINIILNSSSDSNMLEFVNSSFVFSSDYTIIKKMNLKNMINIDRVNNSCYTLNLNKSTCMI